MSEIYKVLKKHIVSNYIQYGDVIKNKTSIPKEIITSVKNIAKESPEQIQLLIDKIKGLNNVTERMCILTIIIDYSEDKELATLWSTLLKETKKDTLLLGQIS